MPTYASGSRLRVAYIPEVTMGVTPNTPQTKALRTKSSTLGLDKASMQSAELRADRQISDLRLGMRKVNGDIDCEFSATSFDDFLEAALGGTWTTNILKAGTTIKSFTIEQGFTDIAQYFINTGCVIDKMTISIKPNAIVGMKFSILGIDQTVAGTSICASPTAAPATSPFDGNNALTVIKVGGTAIAYITGVDITLDNQGKGLEVVGSPKAAGINWGRCKVTGTLTGYIPDVTMYNNFVNETEIALNFLFGDGTKSYDFSMPRVKLMGAKIDVTNEDATPQSLPFQALYHSGSATNVVCTRT